MALNQSKLRSRLGVRIALLFVLCALVPIALLSTVAFTQVIGHLKQQARLRLRVESKAVAMSLVERLAFLEKDLALLAAATVEGRDITPLLRVSRAQDGIAETFTAVAIQASRDRDAMLFGSAVPELALSPAQSDHLRSGKSVVLVGALQARTRPLYLVRALQSEDPAQGIICARINPEYLWNALGDNKPAEMSQLCVLDEENHVIFAHAPVTAEFLRQIIRETQRSSAGLFNWREHGRDQFVGYWSAYLAYHFAVPKWTVVTGIAEDSVLAPVAGFKRGFPLLVLLSFWVVMLLTFSEVRRRMRPLRELLAGTQEIARQNFNGRLSIKTGDEFEELGDAFNNMAETLGRQFHTLTTITEIDKALLASLELGAIADQALIGLGRVFVGSPLAVTLIHTNGRRQARTHVLNPGASHAITAIQSDLKEHELKELAVHSGGVLLSTSNGVPAVLRPICRPEIADLLVFPILLDRNVEGLIGLGLPAGSTTPTSAGLHIRQVADQVALAMANARLVAALRKQNWGIVLALARAVDAKSPWTRGHSERVTQIAKRIAGEMAYDVKQMENLERGTLLHDIGKIGVPVAILDKPGPLTAEERMVIHEHPRMGRRIVEPIDANAEIVDIVSQHHERFDGKGYPLGMEGEAISLSARIVAVADVVDALAADRPYRKGMAFPDVVAMITRESGKAFDPVIVAAFLRVAERAGSLQALTEGATDLEPWSICELDMQG